MVKLDYTYVTHWLFTQDMRLLLRTIFAVAEGRARTERMTTMGGP